MKHLLALAGLLMAACANFPPASTADLVGEWRYADQVRRCDYIFNRDGSFSGQVMERGKLISKFTGRWRIEGRVLIYTYLVDELKRIAAGATDQDKLLRVEPSFFVIEAGDGSRRRYSRIR